MTREEARREIDSLDFYLQNHTDDYGEESHTAMMMAIKALEQQPCEDAISRKAVLDMATTIQTDDCSGNEVMKVVDVDDIKTLPSVIPIRKKGKWAYSGNYDVEGMLYCSNCKHEIDVSEGYFKYCPNCGAKMDE